MEESPADILPDPENPIVGLLRRGSGFCGGLFIVIGVMSLFWGIDAVSPVVGSEYIMQGILALGIGLLLVFIQLWLEKRS